MGREEKLVKRLLSRPRDFTYDELRKVLSYMGYVEIRIGKTSGSRVAFVDKDSLHIIRLHKPHPKNELRLYQIDQILEELKARRKI